MAVIDRAVLTAMLCLAVSGCAVTTSGIATPAAPLSPTTGQDLPALLLPAAEVGVAMSGTDVVVTRDVAALWDDSAHIGGGIGCLAVAGAAQRGVYAETGWTAMQGQVLREPPTSPSWSHFATQAVVLFSSAEAAADFFARSRETWAACTNRDLVYAQQLAPEQLWSIGPAEMDGDVLAVSREQRRPLLWSCQRALTVQGQVAVDVEACSLDGPTRAAAVIARAIAERMGPA